jgi:preprotein translocase subunit SecF
VIQVKFPAAVEIARIESALSGLNLGNASIQSFGEKDAHEYLIRTDLSGFGEADFGDRLREALTTATGQSADIRRVEMVGPQVGKDLRAKALFAMFFALLFITIYISGRFELKWLLSGVVAAAMIGAVLLLQTLGFSIPVLIFGALAVSLVLFWLLKLKFAMGAIVSLMHDVLITVGCFSLFGKEFTLPIIAALLTIIGYSLNDTIIVFDRIRENRRKYLKDPLATIINRSVNETLSRTLLTSGTTLVVVLALFILGGGIIHDFAFALLVGIGVGTYSSIYVASPILLLWEEARRP